MLRPLGAASAVLTMLVGLLVLPHAHVHASAAGADVHHGHRGPLVHAHAAPHRHQGEREDEPTDERGPAQQIRSIEAFVFQSVATPLSLTPVLMATALVQFQLPKLPARLIAAHPPAHGPPLASASGLRAPPLIPPALF